MFRDQSVLDPPSPIPNLAVKQYSADDTSATRLWESRPLRGNPLFLFNQPMHSLTKSVLNNLTSLSLTYCRVFTRGESLKHPSDPDYIFLAKSSAGPLETRRWREDFGIQVIPYEASPGHPEVVELLNFLTERAASTT